MRISAVLRDASQALISILLAFVGLICVYYRVSALCIACSKVWINVKIDFALHSIPASFQSGKLALQNAGDFQPYHDDDGPGLSDFRNARRPISDRCKMEWAITLAVHL